MLILLTFMYCMAFVQTLRDSIDSGRSRLSSRQCAHVNFLKLVQQALSARLRQCSQTRKHSMLTADVVTAITQCHEAAVRLSVASTMLSEQKNPGGAAANKSDKPDRMIDTDKAKVRAIDINMATFADWDFG
jgi:hypothetical protein